MQQESTAVLLRIFIGESDKHDGKAFYEYLVKYLRAHHFSGATVLRGIEGYGHASKIHSANLLDLSTDLPVIIEVVDTEEKIGELKTMFEQLDNALSMLITQEKVTIIRYGKKTS